VSLFLEYHLLTLSAENSDAICDLHPTSSAGSPVQRILEALSARILRRLEGKNCVLIDESYYGNNTFRGCGCNRRRWRKNPFPSRFLLIKKGAKISGCTCQCTASRDQNGIKQNKCRNWAIHLIVPLLALLIVIRRDDWKYIFLLLPLHSFQILIRSLHSTGRYCITCSYPVVFLILGWKLREYRTVFYYLCCLFRFHTLYLICSRRSLCPILQLLSYEQDGFSLMQASV